MRIKLVGGKRGYCHLFWIDCHILAKIEGLKCKIPHSQVLCFHSKFFRGSQCLTSAYSSQGSEIEIKGVGKTKDA